MFLSTVTLLTLIVAIGALVVALWEMRINNKPFVKIIDCKMSIGSSIYDTQPKATFLVRIKNCGICLYNPEMSLCIRSEKEGQTSLEMQRNEDKTGSVVHFARGMIAEFVLEHYCNSAPIRGSSVIRERIATQLTTPKHCIDLVVFSQHFETVRFRLNGRKARIVECYNRWVMYLSKKWYCFIHKKKENEIDTVDYLTCRSYTSKVLLDDYQFQTMQYLKQFITPPEPIDPMMVSNGWKS